MARQKRNTISITDPEDQESKRQIFITIPSFSEWKAFNIKKKESNKKPLYCGMKEQLPNGYERHGTRYECLKKGFGAGMYSVFSANDIYMD